MSRAGRAASGMRSSSASTAPRGVPSLRRPHDGLAPPLGGGALIQERQGPRPACFEEEGTIAREAIAGFGFAGGGPGNSAGPSGHNRPDGGQNPPPLDPST